MMSLEHTAPQIAVSSVSYRPGDRRLQAERRAVDSLLLGLLGEQRGGGLSYRACGAPYLTECPSLGISISHTEGGAVVLLSPQGDVGVDIERLGNQVERVSTRYLTPREEQEVSAHPEAHLLRHLLWSSKEAAFKLVNPPSGSLLSFELATPLDELLEQRRCRLAFLQKGLLQLLCCHLLWDEHFVLAALGALGEDFQLNKELLSTLSLGD